MSGAREGPFAKGLTRNGARAACCSACRATCAVASRVLPKSSRSPFPVQRRAHAMEQRLSTSALPPRRRCGPLGCDCEATSLVSPPALKARFLSTSTANTLNAVIRTPKETHLVGVLNSNGGPAPPRRVVDGWRFRVHAEGDRSPRIHILSTPSGTHAAASVLICPGSSSQCDEIRSAANCVGVAPLGSKAEACEKKKVVGLVSCD